MAYLHERGIVHRDLKPGNIFCDEGVVKVGDYGLSKFISRSRRSGHTESIGTVHYMAPEVANGRYGKEIDVYALGVILYEMLTGRVPFEGESVGEVLMKHLTARPDVSMLAEPYRGVVARALEKDPALRFRSAAEMMAALPREPRRRSSVERAAGTGQRRPSPPVRRRRPGSPAVRNGWRKLSRAWNEAQLNTPLKMLLLLAGLFVVVANAGMLVPLAIALCAAYGIYRLVRACRQPNSREPTAPGTVHSHIAMPQRLRSGPHSAMHATGPLARESPRPRLVVKPPRQRLTELVGSLLASAAVAAAMCVVLVLVESYRADGGERIPARTIRLAAAGEHRRGVGGAGAVEVLGRRPRRSGAPPLPADGHRPGRRRGGVRAGRSGSWSACRRRPAIRRPTTGCRRVSTGSTAGRW